MNKIDFDAAAQKINGNLEITKMILEELYNCEIIRFDHLNNPYWEASGEFLDKNVEWVDEE